MVLQFTKTIMLRVPLPKAVDDYHEMEYLSQTQKKHKSHIFTPPRSSAPQSSCYLPQVLEELHHRSAGGNFYMPKDAHDFFPRILGSIISCYSSWWFQSTPLKNMLVKLDSSSPNFRGENKKYLKPPPSTLCEHTSFFSGNDFSEIHITWANC